MGGKRKRKQGAPTRRIPEGIEKDPALEPAATEPGASVSIVRDDDCDEAVSIVSRKKPKPGTSKIQSSDIVCQCLADFYSHGLYIGVIDVGYVEAADQRASTASKLILKWGYDAGCPNTLWCTLGDNTITLTSLGTDASYLLPSLDLMVKTGLAELHCSQAINTQVQKLYVYVTVNHLVHDPIPEREVFVEKGSPKQLDVASATCNVWMHVAKHSFSRGTSQNVSPEHLYAVCTAKQQVPVVTGENIKHSSVQTTLRPYQLRAIRWMIERERLGNMDTLLDNPMWLPAKSVLGTGYWYHSYSTVFSLCPQLVKDCGGGILADEMGLGKSVEMIGCILGHQLENGNTNTDIMQSFQSTVRNALDIASQSQHQDAMDSEREQELQCFCGGQGAGLGRALICTKCGTVQHAKCTGYFGLDDEFSCATCAVSGERLNAKSTLIVSPSIIKDQWLSEIRKHTSTNALRVLDYKGVKDGDFVRPVELAKYDVVVTTYEVLRKELHHVDSWANAKTSRHRKRYMVVPTPLTCLIWWRVCLDEAQLVDGVSVSQAAEMVSKIPTVHRWCITGTPFRRGFGDLFGLISFLKISPLCLKKLWNLFVNSPLLVMGSAHAMPYIARFLWRNTKHLVQSELQLPIQHHMTHIVELNSIARFHYDRLHEECSGSVRSSITRRIDKDHLDMPLSELDTKTSKVLVAPLLRLRQACDHPMAAKGNILGSLSGQTMKEVAKQMIARVKHVSSESLRSIIMCWNGRAALAQLNELKYVMKLGKDLAREQYNAIRIVAQPSELHWNCIPTSTHMWRESLDHTASKFENYPTLVALKYAERHYEMRGGVWENAEAIYDRVIERYSNYSTEEKEYMVDKLQHIHAMQNLASLLDTRSGTPGIDAKLAGLREQINKIRTEYTLEGNAKVQKYHHSMRKFSLDVKFKTIEWVFGVIRYFQDHGHTDMVIQKLHDELGCMNQGISSTEGGTLRVAGLTSAPNTSLAIKLRNLYSLDGLGMLLQGEFKKIEDHRQCVLKDLRKLDESVSPVQIEVQASCRRCRFERKSRTVETQCIYCDAEDNLIKYELLLFAKSSISEGSRFEMKDPEDNNQSSNKALKNLAGEFFYLKKSGNTSSQALQGPSLTERILRSLGSQYRRAIGTISGVEGMRSFFDHIDALKKEFFACRALWQALWERVSMLDELSMCAQKVEVTPPTGVSEEEKHAFVAPHEFETKITYFQSTELEHATKLDRNWGQLTYLQTLANLETGERLDCPICQRHLSIAYMVFRCGHLCCADCVSGLTKRSLDKRKVQCAVCRSITPLNQLEQVIVGTEDGSSEGDLESRSKVIGDQSPKIISVIRCIQQIRQDDFRAKTIVFSMWSSVLLLLEDALQQNHIRSVRLTGPLSKDQAALVSFKEDTTTAVLLMPIKKGGQGLNLIEATNILLMEPLLDRGMELQAVGRIHRLGQERETFVHRFVTRGTIEVAIKKFAGLEEGKYPSTPSKKNLNGNSDDGSLTIRGLRSMFDLTKDNHASEIRPAALSEAPCKDMIEAFWKEPCRFRSSYDSRASIERKLTIARSYSKRFEDAIPQQLSHSDMMYDLFGRKVDIHIARDLLSLESKKAVAPSDQKAIAAHISAVDTLLEGMTKEGSLQASLESQV